MCMHIYVQVLVYMLVSTCLISVAPLAIVRLPALSLSLVSAAEAVEAVVEATSSFASSFASVERGAAATLAPGSAVVTVAAADAVVVAVAAEMPASVPEAA